MISFLQQSFYFDSNFTDKESSEVQEYHTTREVSTSLASNFLPTQNIDYQPENPTQPSLYDRLMIVLSLQTYISSALKIKKISQSFVDLVKSSQSLQGIGQFFSKKFKGINISAIQLNNSFSFFKRKEIHHHTEIINYNGASEETVQGMIKVFEEKNNDLKDELLAQTRTTIKFLSQKNEEQAQENKELGQKNEELVREKEELVQKNEKQSQKIEEQAQELEVKSRKIELIKNIQAEAFITRSKAHLTLKMITQPSRRRTNSLPPQPVASFN